MTDMKQLRHGWEEVEAFETEILRKASAQENLQDFLELFSEFSEWDEAVETDYQRERETALVHLQQRLACLESYRLAHEARN